MFYDRFSFFCEERGIAETRVLTDLGISKGSLGRWKNGGEPANPTKKKLADYFGVAVSELSGKEKKPDTISDAELSEDELIFVKALRKLPPDKRQLVEQLAITLRNS